MTGEADFETADKQGEEMATVKVKRERIAIKTYPVGEPDRKSVV